MNSEHNSFYNDPAWPNVLLNNGFPDGSDLHIEDDGSDSYKMACDQLRQGLQANAKLQQNLMGLLERLNKKKAENEEKLQRIEEIISLKNKRNKGELKKKQIELYQFENPRLKPHCFNILETIKSTKKKKNFSNLLKNIFPGSSSEEEDNEEEIEEDNEDYNFEDNKPGKFVDIDQKKMEMNEQRTEKLGLNKFLEDYEGKEPKEIDWVDLARKMNLERVTNKNDITGIDLYRKFIDPKIQEAKKWKEEDEENLMKYVQIYGPNNWKQIASNIDGKEYYLQ